MSRSKRFLITACLVAGIFSGCARDEAVLWREFQARKHAAMTDRKPANEEAACFSDRFSAKYLKEEIQAMHGRFPAENAGYRLNFNGRVYDQLPPGLVDFLTRRNQLQSDKGQSWIAPLDTQVSCLNLNDPIDRSTCFAQKLYDAPGAPAANPIEGLAHYWFFLKTGVLMSGQGTYPWYRDLQVTNQSPEGVSLARYLFTSEEWRAWWKTASLLPDSLLHLPSLGTIHRIPHGASPAEWSRGQACSVAFGPWNSGLAVFDDACLRIQPKNPDGTQESPFFAATIHEFGHRFLASHSDQDVSREFLKLSGWQRSQLVTPDGRVRVQWDSNPKAEFVSSFARLDPVEDFAETVSYFRTHPERVAKVAKGKYEYVKRLLFDGRGFAKDDLQKNYVDTAVQAVVKDAGKLLSPCFPNGVPLPEKPQPAAPVGRTQLSRRNPMANAKIAPPQASPSPGVVVQKAIVTPTLTDARYSPLVQVFKFSEKMTKEALTCVEAEILNRIAETMKDLRSTEPEACEALDQSEMEIAKQSIVELNSKLTPHLRGEVPLEAEATAGESGVDSRAALLLCWRQADPRGCYEKDAGKGAEHKEVLTERLSFNQAMADTAEYYEGLMSTQYAELDARAEAVWNRCREASDPIDLTNVRLSPYTGGTAYLPEPVLTCINRELTSEFDDLRARAGAKHDVVIVIPEANAWIDLKILLPRFQAVLDQKVEARQSEDRQRFESAQAGAIDRYSERLIQDFATWQPDLQFQLKVCLVQAGQKLRDRFTSKEFGFLALSPHLEPMAHQICEKVRMWAVKEGKDSVHGLPLPGEQVERIPDALYAKLVSAAVESAKTRFAQCRRPAYKSHRLRRYCLFSEWMEDDQDRTRKNAWTWTRDRAIQAWVKDVEVVKYRESRGYPELAMIEAMQTRAESEHELFVDRILEAFGDK